MRVNYVLFNFFCCKKMEYKHVYELMWDAVIGEVLECERKLWTDLVGGKNLTLLLLIPKCY